jgi:hypothetical protein
VRDDEGTKSWLMQQASLPVVEEKTKKTKHADDKKCTWQKET